MYDSKFELLNFESAKKNKMRKLSACSSKVVLSKILTLAIILTPKLNIIRLSGSTTQTQDGETENY